MFRRDPTPEEKEILESQRRASLGPEQRQELLRADLNAQDDRFLERAQRQLRGTIQSDSTPPESERLVRYVDDIHRLTKGRYTAEDVRSGRVERDRMRAVLAEASD